MAPRKSRRLQEAKPEEPEPPAKPSDSASPDQSSPRQFTFAELQCYCDGSWLWGVELAEAAGIDYKKAFEPHSKDGGEGCVIVFELLRRGQVILDTPQPAQPSEHSQETRETLSEIQNIASALEATRERLSAQSEQLMGVSGKLESLKEELQQVKRAPKAALKSLESKQGGKRSILIAGLVPESSSKADALEMVQEFVHTEVQPNLEVQVNQRCVSVTTGNILRAKAR